MHTHTHTLTLPHTYAYAQTDLHTHTHQQTAFQYQGPFSDPKQTDVCRQRSSLICENSAGHPADSPGPL